MSSNLGLLTLFIPLGLGLGAIGSLFLEAFMPALPVLAAVWVRRAYGPDAPIPWPSLWAYVAGGLVVAAVAGAAIAGVGTSLDSELLVGAVLVVGTGLAIWLGRRRGG